MNQAVPVNEIEEAKELVLYHITQAADSDGWVKDTYVANALRWAGRLNELEKAKAKQ